MKHAFYTLCAVVLLFGSVFASDDEDNKQEVLKAMTPDNGAIFRSEYGQIVTFRFKEKQTITPYIYLKKASLIEEGWGCDKLNDSENNPVSRNPQSTGFVSKRLSIGADRTEYIFKTINQEVDSGYGTSGEDSGNEFAFYLPGGGNNNDQKESPDWGRYKMCIYAKYTDKDGPKWATDKRKVFFKIAQGQFLKDAATFMGIFYFLCWGWAAMPQFFLHHSQKSTAGFSWDYVAISTSTHLIYTIHHIARHIWYNQQKLDQKSTLVDVLNTSWGLCWSSAKCVQCWYYPRSKGQGITWASGGTCTGMFGYALVWLILSAVVPGIPFIKENGLWTFVDQLGMIKVAISFIKYAPQVYENWKNKSTGGFHPLNFLLDIGGVIGSFCQYFLLTWNEADPTYITGSIFSTVGLALVSLFFDAIFVYQHFFLYYHKGHEDELELELAETGGKTSDGKVAIAMEAGEKETTA